MFYTVYVMDLRAGELNGESVLGASVGTYILHFFAHALI
jgi:hypothetical protein